ncbi:retrovirus-related pol polyprotein from transposon TNT 1-94 [Tanacetum coccineum]
MQLSAEQSFWLPLSNPKSEQLDVTQTPVEIEVPKELPKVCLVKTSFQKLKNHLASFDKVVKVRTTPDAITEGSWGFEHTKKVFIDEVIPFINSLRATFKDFDNGLHNELNEVKTAFNQMEAAVEQCSEVLVYDKATCPSLTKHSEKLVAVTTLNKNKKVRFAETAMSSSNTQKQADSHKTQDSNKPVLPSIGMKSSISATRSQPLGNTMKHRMSQTTRRTFTIIGNSCPLTRITSNKVVPLKETTSKSVTILNLEVKIYSRRTKGSTASNSPSSSLVNFRFSNDQIAMIMGYGDYQMGNVTIFRVYYVEGLGHNLLSVGQFCDSDLEAKAVATTCYTPNRSLIRKRHNKTPYDFLHNMKPDLSHLHVMDALCYPNNDSEDLGKLKPKAYIGICVGYAHVKKAYLIYNKRTRLVPNPPSATPYVPPTKKDWDTLFQPMFDEYFNPPPSVVSPVLYFTNPSRNTISNYPSGVEEDHYDIEVAHLDNDPFFGVPIPEPNSEESSSSDVIRTNVHSANQPPEHLRKWTKDYPLDNVIGSPSRPVSTRHQLHNEAMFCYFDAFLTSVESKKL